MFFFIINVLIFFCYGSISVISQCYSLVYRLPNYLVKWVGGHPDQGTEEEVLGEIKEQAESGAGSLGSAAAKQASAAEGVQTSVGMADFQGADNSDSADKAVAGNVQSFKNKSGL